MTDTIPEEKISEIRQRASIVEVVSDLVSLKKSGKNYLGLCPFHSERTPSFSMLFLNLRSAASKGSLSRKRMLGTVAYTPLLAVPL